MANFEVEAVVINDSGVTDEMTFKYSGRHELSPGDTVKVGRNELAVVQPAVRGVLYLRTTLPEADIRSMLQADQRFQPVSGRPFDRCVHWPRFEPGDGYFRQLTSHQCVPGL